MTLVSRGILSRLLAIVLVVTAIPALAAERRRAVGATSPPLVNGVVTDANTGAPVVEAVITGGAKSVNTDDNGAYTIEVVPGVEITLTAQRFGYNSASQTVKVFGPQTVNFKLVPKPSLTVKLVNGETHRLDLETSKFAYLTVFIGYTSSDNANFCKTDGTNWQPLKSEFSRVVGPAVSTNNPTCCTLGPIMTLNVEMKSGDKLQVYFVDSCYGNEVDFLGRDLATRRYAFFRFTDIAEIDFP